MPLLGATSRRRPGAALGLAILLAASLLDAAPAVRLDGGLPPMKTTRSPAPLGRRRAVRRGGLALGLAAAAGLIRGSEAQEGLVSEAPQLQSDFVELDIEFDGRDTRRVQPSEAPELGDIDDRVAAFWLSARHEDPAIRLRALENLQPMPEEVPAELAAIVKELLWDAEFDVREAAMLKWMAINAAWIDLTYLRSNSVHRVAAVLAVGYMTPPLAPDQRALLELSLRDDDIMVRAAAAMVMAKHFKSIWVDAHTVRRALAGDDVHMRRAAAMALPQFVRGSDCVEELQAVLDDPDSEVRVRALVSLSGLAPLSAGAMAALRGLLRDADPRLQKSAIDLLAEMPSAVEPGDFELLLNIMKNHNDVEAQWAAAIAVRDLGIYVWPGGLEGLCDALLSEDVVVRRAASMAIAYLENTEPSQEQLELIHQMLEDADPFVRWTASQLFNLPAMDIWFGGVEEIHDALRHGDAFIGQVAASSLGSLGDALTPADLQALLQAYRRKDFLTRFAVIHALIHLGAVAGQEGRDAVAEALNDESPTVVEVAMHSILGFDPSKG